MTALTGHIERSREVTVEFFRRANVVALLGPDVGALRCDDCGRYVGIETRILLSAFVSMFLEFAAEHQHVDGEQQGALQ